MQRPTPRTPAVPPKWDVLFVHATATLNYMVGFLLNGFLTITAVDWIEQYLISEPWYVMYLEEFMAHSTVMIEGKIIDKKQQGDKSFVVVTYPVNIPQSDGSTLTCQVQKTFANHHYLHHLCSPDQSITVCLHPKYIFSGIPAWEFNHYLSYLQDSSNSTTVLVKGVLLVLLAGVVHYVLCTYVWTHWLRMMELPMWVFWAMVVPAPLHRLGAQLWYQQRRLTRFQEGFLHGTYSGLATNEWSMMVQYVE